MTSLGLVLTLTCAAYVLTPTASSGQPTEGDGWPQMDRHVQYGNYWDLFTNRHYGGFRYALTWPGGWWDHGAADPVERRTYANYKGFLIGARNVQDPQYPDVIWPYMVGQRDGRNDGERGEALPPTPPDPQGVNDDVQFLFKGRLDRRTFRQAYPVVTVDGVQNVYLQHLDWGNIPAGWRGYPGDEEFQFDTFDPDLPADLTLDTHSWSRMGISTQRRVYAFADRRNDDYMFWHWRMVNDGIWGRMGVDMVDCCGGEHGTIESVMMSIMFQWDRGSAGSCRTNSTAEHDNDSVWRYYGLDYDGAQTEDMRLVYVVDGDQDPAVYSPPHGRMNDIGDPDPDTGALLSAKTGGWQILHYDVSTSDRGDDIAQPRTLGWQNYAYLIRTGAQDIVAAAGHEAKYNQMLLGYQGVSSGEYYLGPWPQTPGRGIHPNAATHSASWIKASNDPATSGAYWPGKVLGIDVEVTDVEQQAGFGPDDIGAGETVNALFAVGVKGLDEPYADAVGRQWYAGEVSDVDKDALVHSTIDSLFKTMRQAKAVYESADFGGRYASTRDEFEAALDAAVGAGLLALSPPAPATFAVNSGTNHTELSWTLNTTTGSDIAGWRLYRAHGSFKGDSTFALIAELPPSAMSYNDFGLTPNEPYYYYLTTFDADGNESTMHTRTSDPVSTLVSNPTEVSGAITTQTWESGESPYRVIGAITVPAGNTLTIQPGVDVVFDVDVPFVVEGRLRAMGTAASNVRFVPGEATAWGGLRVSGGDSSTISYARIRGGQADGASPDDRGGAVYLSGQSTRLGMSHCVLSDNTARWGGGVDVRDGSAVTLSGCVVAGNAASSGWGGGLNVQDATATLEGCDISGNESRWGGGLHADGSAATLTSCSISDNAATDNGGAMDASSTALTLSECTISGNHTSTYDGGGLHIVQNSEATLTSCTISGNTAARHGGGIAVGSNATVMLVNGIVWGNADHETYNYPEAAGTIIATYTDIQGDTLWAGEGNINADPRFVDAVAGDYHLQPGSPCIDAGDPAVLDPDGTRSDMGAFYHPQVLSPDNLVARDVPNDQGGRVVLTWTASSLDTNENTMPGYSVWRALPEGVATKPGGTYRVARLGGAELIWEWLESPLAHQFAQYAYTAPTLFDSMSTTDAVHRFMVSAHTSDPSVYYDSEVVAGHSVDDLAPAAPIMRPATRGEGWVKLSWSGNSEADLGRYLLFRGDLETSRLGQTTPFATTLDTTFVDRSPSSGLSFYVVFAQDIHENTSLASRAVNAYLTGIATRPTPTAFALGHAAPNPFNPTTRIDLAVPSASTVRIVAYDASGRVARTLVDGIRQPGWHSIVWDGRDDLGRDAASGIYFVRMVAGDFVGTRRVTLVR